MKSFQNLLSTSITNLPHIKFNQQLSWHRHMVCLYCSILEYCDTLLFLHEQKKGIGIPLVSRAITEAFIDVKNLCADENYTKHMEVSFLKQWLKIVDEARKKQNPYLEGMIDLTDFDKDVAEWQRQSDELIAQGIKELKICKKFSLADMDNEYRSVYNFLCADSHNNIRSLVSRHIRLSEDGQDYSLVIFDDAQADYLEKDLIWCEHLLRNAGRLIHQKFNSGLAEQFLDAAAGPEGHP